MPINDRWDIEDVLASVRRYIASANANRAKGTDEYVLLDHGNDGTEHAHELAQLMKDTPCKINLIPFNPFPNSDYQRPSRNAIIRFQNAMIDAGYVVTVRSTRGDDIDAAWGQLVGQVMDRTRRSAK